VTDILPAPEKRSWLRRVLQPEIVQRAEPVDVERRYATIGSYGYWRANSIGATTAGSSTASAIVYRCVHGIASSAASVDLAVDVNGELRLDHPTALLWNRLPNPAMSSRVFKEILWAQLEYRGQAFVAVDRGPSGEGEARSLWPVYDEVEVVIDDRTDPLRQQLLGFRVHTQQRTVPMLPGELLWLRYPDSNDPWGCLAPLRAASFAADLDAYARAWQLNEFRNGARPSGVVYMGDLTDEQFEQTRSEFQAAHSGPANAGKHLFFSGPQRARYDRIGLTPAEMSYLDSRLHNFQEIALAFGYPWDLLWGQATYDNRRAAKIDLWTETLVPKLEVVAGEVDRQMLPDLAESATFDLSNVDALQENQDAISNRVRTSVYADVLTIDEAREALGRDPLPNGQGAMTLTAYRVQFQQPRGGVEAPVQALVAERPVETRQAVIPASTVEREYDRLEAKLQRAVRRLAEKQAKLTLGRLRKLTETKAGPTGWETRANPDDLFDRVFWREQTAEALEEPVGAVWDAGAARMAAALGLDLGLFDDRVLTAMRNRLQVLADVVSETTYDTIARRILEPGAKAGESVPKLADRLQSVFDDLGGYRAETIARTETVGGFNSAGHEVARSSGVTTRKRWLAARDSRVRDEHAEMDGETVLMDEPFSNGAQYPGDPAAPADTTINCRCVCTYVVDDEGAA